MIKLSSCILLLSGLLLSGSAIGREPISIDTLSRPPVIRSVSMSADGRNLVALVRSPRPGDDDAALATWSLDNLEAGPTITPSGDRMKFVAANALKADRVLVIARQEWTGKLGGCGEGRSEGATKTFVTKAYLTDIAHQNFSEAFADNTRSIGVSAETQRCLELAGSASLVSSLPLDPDNVIVSQLSSVSLRQDYYLYNLRTNATSLLFRGGARARPALFNPRNGDVLVRTQLEGTGASDYEERYHIRNAQTGQFEVHANLTRKLTDRFTFDFEGIDEASGKYYVLTDLLSDHVQARMYDPVARKFDEEPLVAHPRHSIARIILGTQRSNFNRVLGYVVGGTEGEVTYVDPDMAAVHSSLKQAYPGQSVMIGAYNDDLSRVLFTSSGARHSPAYHLLSDRKQVITLGREHPEIRPEMIGEQRWVTYPARDGLQIPAIVDLPAGWTEAQGPLPAIIHPHGGPWARDSAGWDRSGWVPFLTSRGYAVMRPQYRGSTGFGRRLWMAGDAEWGQKMQDDKDDGAAWLVSQGIAAKDRIAIFGYSYGGFAAAAAAVRPDSPYQCAISGAPVTDLARLSTTWSENRVQRILQAQTITGMDPLRNADKASIPVLLYVGDRDVRTPAFHARNFYNAIRNRVPARFELVADMPHSMPWYPRHQQQTLGLIETFLRDECGPEGL